MKQELLALFACGSTAIALAGGEMARSLSDDAEIGAVVVSQTNDDDTVDPVGNCPNNKTMISPNGACVLAAVVCTGLPAATCPTVTWNDACTPTNDVIIVPGTAYDKVVANGVCNPATVASGPCVWSWFFSSCDPGATTGTLPCGVINRRHTC